MKRVYLLLGGNQGDVPGVFKTALQRMEDAGIRIVRQGSLFKTEPWGMEDAAMFYNQAVETGTTLSPHGLLKVIGEVESLAGRKRRPGKTDSRPLDVDILLYEDMQVNAPDLVIPHPRMHLRRFALAPLADIAPDVVHPVSGKTIRELLDACRDPLHVEKLDDK